MKDRTIIWNRINCTISVALLLFAAARYLAVTAAEVTDSSVEATESPVEASESSVEATESTAEATESTAEVTESTAEVTESPVEFATAAGVWVGTYRLRSSSIAFDSRFQLTDTIVDELNITPSERKEVDAIGAQLEESLRQEEKRCVELVEDDGNDYYVLPEMTPFVNQLRAQLSDELVKILGTQEGRHIAAIGAFDGAFTQRSGKREISYVDESFMLPEDLTIQIKVYAPGDVAPHGTMFHRGSPDSIFKFGLGTIYKHILESGNE